MITRRRSMTWTSTMTMTRRRVSAHGPPLCSGARASCHRGLQGRVASWRGLRMRTTRRRMTRRKWVFCRPRPALFAHAWRHTGGRRLRGAHPDRTRSATSALMRRFPSAMTMMPTRTMKRRMTTITMRAMPAARARARRARAVSSAHLCARWRQMRNWLAIWRTRCALLKMQATATSLSSGRRCVTSQRSSQTSLRHATMAPRTGTCATLSASSSRTAPTFLPRNYACASSKACLSCSTASWSTDRC
mmetsp:Transcript_601/g.1639  ORF Transcript_601/g.1639 Transcript_601/m.1639 type:complete len:247 (-) Transcript_601:1991-2731(-)